MSTDSQASAAQDIPRTSHIRDFCIIAHIDHGKSTLADRMIQLTNTVSSRDMQDQMLDTMDLERERGITIKLQPVRMQYRISAASQTASQGRSDMEKAESVVDGDEYTLNLIDTPGHVDFAYEVSRSLAAVEGAIILVDASQGVQAQTLSTLYQAMDQNLTIIPVINKIDLPHAEPERRAQELVKLLGCDPSEIIFASGKSGVGVADILDRVVERVPAPAATDSQVLRALVFDCIYDPYRGVIAYVRVVDGELSGNGTPLRLIQGGKETEALEVGYFRPQREKATTLRTGEIGYIVTGLKEVSDIGIGDTLTFVGKDIPEPLPGYRQVTPMVFASLYATDSDQYPQLREAIGKLKLNDAALQYLPEHSPALGFGFRCGFLGMLHMEVAIERLRREHDVDVIATVPSVAYEVTDTMGITTEVHSPSELPDPTRIEAMAEPWVKLEVVTPNSYVGGIMELSNIHRGVYKDTQYLEEDRVLLTYQIPLSEIVVSYYDDLKSISSGYASMSYEILGFRPAKLAKMDILVAGNQVDALSTIVPAATAESSGRKVCERLKELIPRHNFEVAIQAAINGKVIARETISAMRKDVTAKLYGGDVTRKNKLLDLGKEKDRAKIWPLVEEFHAMIIALGGCISAEHNDGLLRSPYLQQQYGEELYGIFRDVKRIFDPAGFLNPGKKVDVDLERSKTLLRDSYGLEHLVSDAEQINR